MRGLLALVLVLLVMGGAGEAVADGNRISGFSTESKGVISGQVLEESGEPARNVVVYVTTVAGELQTTTDDQGRYSIDLGTIPGSKMVFVRKVARINGQTMVQSTSEDGEEVVEILEADQPKVMPRATAPTNRIPEYTRQARDANVWTKAWLLLHVGRDGKVKRLKVLHAPGYELEEGAVRDAFNLSFEPALDRTDKPVPVMVLWSYEWPSYWWLVEHRYAPHYVPAEVAAVPCRGTPGEATRKRDCTQADMTQAHSLPWISRKKFLATGVIAKVGHSKLDHVPVAIPTEDHGPRRWYQSRAGWSLTTAGASLGLIAGYLFYTAYQLDQDADAAENSPLGQGSTWHLDNSVRGVQWREDASTRRTAGYALGAVGVAMFAAGIRQFSLHVSPERATASVSWNF